MFRRKAERPRLAHVRDFADHAISAVEGSGAVQNAGMNISENQARAGMATSYEVQNGVDGIGLKIVGDAFPKKYRRLRGVEIRLRQNFRQFLAIEVDLDETDMGGDPGEQFTQAGEFGSVSGRVVHFEDGGGAHFRKAVGAAIETGAKNDDLPNVLFQRGAQSVVDEDGAGDGGGTRATEAAVDVGRNKIAKNGELGQSDKALQGRAKEMARERIRKEAAIRRTSRFQRAEKGHVFGGATGLAKAHLSNNKCAFLFKHGAKKRWKRKPGQEQASAGRETSILVRGAGADMFDAGSEAKKNQDG